MPRRLAPVVALLLLVTSQAVPVRAQDRDAETFEIVLRGVPLREALETLVRRTQIDLVYSSDIVAPVEVFCVRENATAEALLKCVLEGTGLEYVRSLSGAYVLIPAVRRPAMHGSLAGAVVDAETGEPLPYANVFLAEARTGTAANEAGLFTLAPLVTGPYHVMVTYVGYETTVDTVFIQPGGRHLVEVPLHSSGVALRPVVVDGLEQRLPSNGLGNEELQVAEFAQSTSFGTPDVARAAATLPGISVQRPLADLHIQGGSAGSHVVLLDGAPVREPVSLGRHLSAFSPLALGRMTVQRAGFSAADGSNLTGRLELEHDLSVEGRTDLKLTVDPISLNARVGARFDETAPVSGSAMLALRTSLWDLYREPYIDELFKTWHAADPLLTSYWIGESVTPQTVHVMRQVPEVRFSDLHGAVRLRPSSFQTLDASVYRARNQLGSTMAAMNANGGESASLFATDDLYDWTNWLAQARYGRLLGARTLVSAHVRGSWHSSRYTYGTGLATTGVSDPDLIEKEQIARLIDTASEHTLSDESNRISEVSFGFELQHSITSRSGVSTGIDVSRVASRFRLGSPFIAKFAYDVEAWQVGGHISGDVYLGVGTVVEPGLRATYVPARDAAYFEPRLAIRHDRMNTAIGDLAARLSGGVYRQFVNEYELTSSGSTAVVPFVFFWLPVGESLAPPRAYHLALDGMLMPSRQWTLNLSLYHKWQPRLLVLDYPALVAADGDLGSRLRWLQQDGFVTPASGRAYGGDIRARFDGGRWAAAAGYALSIAHRTIPNRFDGKAQPLPWNVPHQVFGGAKAEVANGLNVELDAQLAIGRTWVYREAYYDYLLNTDDPAELAPLRLTDPSNEQLPAAVMVDVGVSYRFSWKGASAQIRLFALNVLDRDNLYERNAFGESGLLQSFGRSLPGRSLLLALSFER
ncbi:MAG TPA: carboxypeptidase-like regulatory domain-containing protein [Rhodothermales bacterium]